MCIAILNRNGILPKETFLNSWQSNPDGAGFAYFDGKKVIIRKEMNNPEKLYKQYSKDRKRNGGDFLVHFRIGTSGLKDVANCHPFRISETAAFIHNGIITDTTRAGNYSDTYHFNEEIIKKIPQKYLSNYGIVQLMAGFIGYSKLVFLIRDRAFLVNENLGHWDGGNWYSNKSYQCTIVPKTYRKPERDYWNKWDELETYTEYGYQSKAPHVYCDSCMATGATYCSTLNADLCRECLKIFEPEKYERWSK